MADIGLHIDFEDWRESGLLSPVKSQGAGICCYGFAACYLVEILYCLDKNNERRVELSPQDLWNNLGTLDEEDDEEDEKGVTIVETLEWIRENGCVLENDCPYTQELEVVPPAPDQHRLVRMRIVTVKPIPRKRMEEHIQYNAPVIVETDWIDEMDDLHGDTIYSGPILASAFEKSTKHGVLVVGFGREMVGNEEVRFWIIQNSHSPDWGNNGFFKFNQAEIHNRYLVNNAWAALGISYSSPDGEAYPEIN